MKKSEMHRIIAQYLAGKEPFNIYPHELLEVIQKAGMMPPMIYGKTVIIGRDGRTGEPVAYDVSGNPINAWEIE
jgi:hypothetical protein